MKIGFVTMEVQENRPKDSVGSSRIRANWLTNYWPDAELYRMGQKYDAMIFQKAYFLEMISKFDGIKIFDICDPDWLEGKPVIEAFTECDAITTSTPALAEAIKKMVPMDKPVLCIPDRIDRAEHTIRKQHEGKARSVAWFGYHTNQRVIDQTLSTLKRLGLQLIVISDSPYYPESSIQGIDDEWIRANIQNIKYDYATICEDLAAADMVINPRLESGRFIYKSNNKSLTAWGIGMPVANTAEDIEKFMDPEARKQEAELRLKEVEQFWDVKQSVAAYEELINYLQLKKNAGIIPPEMAERIANQINDRRENGN